MKQLKIILLTFTCLFISIDSFSQACDLFFSEYVEGSLHNKYLEIYNSTGAIVNLSDYRIDEFANGASSPSYSNVLSGTLIDGAVKVYGHSSATLYTGTVTSITACNFNGDDAIGLYKISTSSYIDIIGNIGCDPGAQWKSGGNHLTLDRTLVRNPDVCCGVSIDPSNSPCDFPTLASEWTEYPEDDVSHLGNHVFNCPCNLASEPTKDNAVSNVLTDDCNLSATISFNQTPGSGTNRIYVVSKSTIMHTPTDQKHYNADNNFGEGDSIGPGEYVVYNDTGNSATINGLQDNTTYYWAVFEYNGTMPNCEENYFTSDFYKGSFPIDCNCPQIKAIMVNPCGKSSEEGYNEFIKIKTGSWAADIDELTIDLPDGKTFCNSGCGTKTIGNDATAINKLNTKAGCNLFTYSSTIPKEDTLIIFTGSPTYDYDFSSECAYKPIYVAFLKDGSSVGHFANSASAERTLKVHLSISCTDLVSYYSSSANTGMDGDYVEFALQGDSTFKNTGECIIPLASNKITFQGKSLMNSIHLNWQILNTNPNMSVQLFKRTEQGFHKIVEYKASHSGSYVDLQPSAGYNYYKISLVDKQNKSLLSKKIAVKNNTRMNFKIYPNPIKQGGELIILTPKDKNESCTIYSITGKKIAKIYPKNSSLSEEINKTRYTVNLPKGIYFIHINSNRNNETKKLIVY